jgi:hypothetical protein
LELSAIGSRKSHLRQLSTHNILDSLKFYNIQVTKGKVVEDEINNLKTIRFNTSDTKSYYFSVWLPRKRRAGKGITNV